MPRAIPDRARRSPSRPPRRAKSRGGDLRVGDRVVMINLPELPPGIIVEDRGDLGPGGAQVVRVRPLDDLDEMGITDDRSFEAMASSLRKVTR